MRALCERVGERVWVLLDEALADFLEPGEDAAGLVAELPNLLVFRTFAKAHAMAGFRIGYVLAPAPSSPSASPRRSRSTPPRRRRRPGRSSSATRRSPAAAPPRRASATGSPPRCTAPRCRSPDRRAVRLADLACVLRGEIAAHLGVRRIEVAPGERWGDERHVRVTLRDGAATERLIAALRELD